jgi:hypothetical protein
MGNSYFKIIQEHGNLCRFSFLQTFLSSTTALGINVVSSLNFRYLTLSKKM